jgi:endogenous inhibitor of DNA gyrase (YacG/DUF329 family)
MSVASIDTCRKCGTNYFTSTSDVFDYCSSHCKDTDVDLEDRVESLENKMDILEKQLNECLNKLKDYESHNKINDSA